MRIPSTLFLRSLWKWWCCLQLDTFGTPDVFYGIPQNIFVYYITLNYRSLLFFLFFIFFVLPHRWYRQLQFVAFLHNSAIPFHHHLEKEKFHSLVSGVFRLSMVMKNDFVLYNLCSNLFTIFAVDVKRTSARAYELLNLHDDDDEEFRLEISFYERHNEKNSSFWQTKWKGTGMATRRSARA